MSQERIVYKGRIIGYIRKQWERGNTWYWGIVEDGNITYKENFHDRQTAEQWIFWKRGITT